MSNPDFLIIGAGVVGLSTAWQLTKEGASVELIDKGFAGREASWAGGGMLFCIRPWEYATAVTSLVEWSRSLYADWTTELMFASNIDPEYRKTGLVILPPFDIEQAKTWCHAHNVRADTITNWAKNPSTTSPALRIEDVAQVRNPRLIKSLIGALKSRGVKINDNAGAVKIVTDKRRVTGISTTDRMLSAHDVIVCAGAWSSALLQENAAGLNIVPVRGQMLLYKPPIGTLDTILLREDHYLIPRADGHLLAGSTRELAGFKNETTEEAATELHRAAIKMLPYLEKSQPIAHWAGLRPGLPRNIPVIAKHPTIDNLYVNSGHFRYGLTMAPAAAILLSNLIQGKNQPLEMANYAWRSNCETSLLK